LNYIDRGELLTPIQVIQTLARTKQATVGIIKNYINTRVGQLANGVIENSKQTKLYIDETNEMRNKIEEFKTSVTIFQVNKCSSCMSPLDLPVIHFLCQHAYHIHCLSENEKECPICTPNFKQLKDVKKSLIDSASQHDLFFKQLEGSPDGFATVAEYCGRNLFSQKK